MSGQRNGLDVLHDDRHLLAVGKPAGMPVRLPGPPTSGSLVGCLAGPGDEGDPLLVSSQPLEDGCSGVELLARSPMALGELENLLSERRITRSYLALVAGNVGAVGVIHLPVTLGGTEGDGEARKVQARTRYERVARLPDLTLVRVRPDRFGGEQVLQHLRRIGHPVGGDLEGTESFNLWLQAISGSERLLLHCAESKLRHPATDEALRLAAPLGVDFWSVLRCLGFADEQLRGLALPAEPAGLPPVADPPPELPDADFFPGMWSGELPSRR